jgi:hypothetical protein
MMMVDTLINNDFWVDWQLRGNWPRPGTHVDIVKGGSVTGNLQAHGYSIVDIHGGYIGGRFDAENYCNVRVFAGAIASAFTLNSNASAIVSGGKFGGQLQACDYSKIIIQGRFDCGYGELNRSGKLTGVLANGDLIDNYYHVEDTAHIILTAPGISVANLLQGLKDLICSRSFSQPSADYAQGF